MKFAIIFHNFSAIAGYTKELPPPIHLLNGLAYLVVMLSSWIKSRQVCKCCAVAIVQSTTYLCADL